MPRSRRTTARVLTIARHAATDSFSVVARAKHLSLPKLQSGRQLCPHDRDPSHCRACGGKSDRHAVCRHGSRRVLCLLCGGGSERCPHGKKRSVCIPCGGSQGCEHGRRRAYCHLCGGSSFCAHGKWKRHCLECNNDARGRCPHGLLASCVACGKPWFECPHGGKDRRACTRCATTKCRHGTPRHACKRCRRDYGCEHGVKRSQCVQCDGRRRQAPSVVSQVS